MTQKVLGWHSLRPRERMPALTGWEDFHSCPTVPTTSLSRYLIPPALTHLYPDTTHISLPPENDTIYWVDMGLSTISRAKRDQTWREDVVTNGIGRVEGIAVDWIAGKQFRARQRLVL
jgi:hypothetical protein